jgi:hypothetical protein
MAPVGLAADGDPGEPDSKAWGVKGSMLYLIVSRSHYPIEFATASVTSPTSYGISHLWTKTLRPSFISTDQRSNLSILALIVSSCNSWQDSRPLAACRYDALLPACKRKDPNLGTASMRDLHNLPPIPRRPRSLTTSPSICLCHKSLQPPHTLSRVSQSCRYRYLCHASPR